jgi:hypothetical protein
MILIRLLAIFLLLSSFFSTALQRVGAVPIAPDFTGTWKIDRDLSTPKAISDFDDLTLVVSQNNAELKVKRIIEDKKHKERVSEQAYFTDGRGEKVSLLFGTEKWNSKTNWVNDTIVCKFTVTEYISASSDFYFADYKETWALLQHGNTLMITTEKTVRNVPDFYRRNFTDETYRKVFHRAIS